MARYRMREWPQECPACKWTGKILAWDYDFPLSCPRCKAQTNDPAPPNRAPGVFSDGIPGGILIRHGLCNADGSPRRYDSKTEIRAEAARRGMTISGETPKVHTEF